MPHDVVDVDVSIYSIFNNVSGGIDFVDVNHDGATDWFTALWHKRTDDVPAGAGSGYGARIENDGDVPLDIMSWWGYFSCDLGMNSSGARVVYNLGNVPTDTSVDDTFARLAVTTGGRETFRYEFDRPHRLDPEDSVYVGHSANNLSSVSDDFVMEGHITGRVVSTDAI